MPQIIRKNAKVVEMLGILQKIVIQRSMNGHICVLKMKLPKIPELLSEKSKDFLSKCFVKDPEKRWTAEMFLNHSFIAVDLEDDQREDFIVKLKEEEQVLMSPKCPFKFPDWESMSSDSHAISALDSPVERLGNLVSETIPDWSVGQNWVTVR